VRRTHLIPVLLARVMIFLKLEPRYLIATGSFRQQPLQMQSKLMMALQARLMSAVT
jgi:chromosome condensin MukBEF MukE localization factor